MNKLLIALIAGGFAIVAAAQTTAPTKKEMNAEKAKEVGTVTSTNVDQAGARDTATQQKANTAKSKEVAKPTHKQKQSDAKAATAAGGMNSSGTIDTAAQQKANTAKSKEIPKQHEKLGTPAAEKQLQKAATP